MKIFRIAAFIILIISNILFFVYGWINHLDSENQRSINGGLQFELQMKDQEIMKLNTELENIKNPMDSLK